MLGVRLVCLWPGLPGAWLRGRVHHLFLALAAAWFACFLLLATYLWPEWIGLGSVRILWLGAAAIWLFAAIWGHWQYAGLIRSHAPEQLAAFVQAQAEYLQGNWFAAEAQLLAILQEEPRDAEAMLLLVSVLRQTRRWRPALRRLNQLELLETAQPWRHEVVREKALIERAIAGSTGTPEDVTEESPEGNSEENSELQAGLSEEEAGLCEETEQSFPEETLLEGVLPEEVSSSLVFPEFETTRGETRSGVG